MGYVYEEQSAFDIARKLYADENAGWSREGAKALADWLVEYASEAGQPLELDIVALRCDYAEYASIEAYNADVGADYEDIDALRDDAGIVIEFDGGIIVNNF